MEKPIFLNALFRVIYGNEKFSQQRVISLGRCMTLIDFEETRNGCIKARVVDYDQIKTLTFQNQIVEFSATGGAVATAKDIKGDKYFVTVYDLHVAGGVELTNFIKREVLGVSMRAPETNYANLSNAFKNAKHDLTST